MMVGQGFNLIINTIWLSAINHTLTEAAFCIVYSGNTGIAFDQAYIAAVTRMQC